MLFTFPSRYWFAIGLSRVFSLGGWSRRIHTGFHVSRATQDFTGNGKASRKGLSPAMAPFSSGFRSSCFIRYGDPTTPQRPEPLRFGLFPVRSPLLGESMIFSLPTGTKKFQFPAFASVVRQMTGIRPAGLSHSEICGSQDMCSYPQLIAACHVLRRL